MSGDERRCYILELDLEISVLLFNSANSAIHLFLFRGFSGINSASFSGAIFARPFTGNIQPLGPVRRACNILAIKVSASVRKVSIVLFLPHANRLNLLSHSMGCLSWACVRIGGEDHRQLN